MSQLLIQTLSERTRPGSEILRLADRGLDLGGLQGPAEGLVAAEQSALHQPVRISLALQKNRVLPDGTILHDLRVPSGYWEAKDTDDELDEEIEKKKPRGYPQDNIIFEDSRNAV